MRTQTGGGRYEYRTQAVPGGWNIGNKMEGELLVGWQFIRGRHALAIYGGVNVVDNRLDRPDPGNRDQGTQFGAKGVVEWFYRLDERWVLTAALGGSTADGTVTGRATAGWKAFDWLDVGMEVGATTDWLDESARIGLFIATPLAAGRELRVAGGWRWSRKRRQPCMAPVDLPAVLGAVFFPPDDRHPGRPGCRASKVL